MKMTLKDKKLMHNVSFNTGTEMDSKLDLKAVAISTQILCESLLDFLQSIRH